MIRRTLLAAAALFVTGALSSCATFTDNDDAARVGETTLSNEAIPTLVDDDQPTIDPEIVRTQLTKWIRVTLLEAANGTSTASDASATNLDARLDNAIEGLATNRVADGQAFYERGTAVSGLICLAAIPLESADAAPEVLGALESGLSFADAAAQFSIDPGLAANGGVVLGTDGAECFGAQEVNPDLLTAFDGVAIGQPTLVNLTDVAVVAMLRSYADLSDQARLQISRQAVQGEEISAIIDEADVYVDPRYGYWSSDTATVVAMGA